MLESSTVSLEEGHANVIQHDRLSAIVAEEAIINFNTGITQVMRVEEGFVLTHILIQTDVAS